MSDASDALGRAVVANRKLAASLLVRKQELEAQIAGGDARAELATELAGVEVQLQAALTEVAALRKRAAGLPGEEARALAHAALEPDPLLRTPEEAALDHVREHLAELQAKLHLSDELAGRAASRPQTPEEAEADARRQLAEMRAKLPPKP